jgi:hypothetical protein
VLCNFQRKPWRLYHFPTSFFLFGNGWSFLKHDGWAKLFSL